LLKKEDDERLKNMQTTLKNRAKKTIDELSGDKIRVAVDFLDYLKNKEEAEATLEILSSHELMRQLKSAGKAIKAGKLDEFVPWDKIKRHV
jgi:hypothetical protein